MSLETYELDKKMLEYSISQFRNIPEYVKICEAFAVGAESIQHAVDYLSNMIDLSKAEGIWLDYRGWLVGKKRDDFLNISDYFCANAEDVNEEKLFWFANQSTNQQMNLADEIYRGQVYGKIGYNISKCTRNENIKIIKNITMADHCIINKARVYENYTVGGSPTITDDGIASGFSESNYLYSNFTSVTPTQSIILRAKGVYSSTPNAANGAHVLAQIVGTNSSPSIEASSSGIGAVRFHTSGNTGLTSAFISVSLQDGDIIEAEVIATSTYVTINAKINGVSYTNTWSGNGLYCGAISGARASINNDYYWTGSIDLNAFKIYVDDILVYRTYTEQPMVLDVTLYGNNILQFQGLRQTIESILGNGIGIDNLEIRGLDEYGN